MKKITTLLVSGIFSLFFITQVFADKGGPLEQVRFSVDKVMSIVQDKSLAGDDLSPKRRQLIFEVLDYRFDYKEMSRRTLGKKNWKKLSASEKIEFVEIFSKLLKNIYVRKIESYTEETIKYSKPRTKKNRAIVKTILMQDKVELPIIYRLVDRKGKWLVYDVIIEGVSIVKNYRSQFGRILARQGYQGLISQVKDKVKQNETAGTR
jgi:phospholipid transport system substrate-binding protein